MSSRLQKILEEKGYKDLIDFLSTELSESQLNSLLMEIFKNRTDLKSPGKVLQDFIENRFVIPSTIDPVLNGESEIQALKIARATGFKLCDFSPLTPLGTTSVHGTVHQNNIVSSLRRTEVVSDITNVIALEMAKRIKATPSTKEHHIATTHRLVRGQSFDNPNYTAHFRVLGMGSSWLDRGNFTLESEYLIKHIDCYLSIFRNVYSIEEKDLVITILTPIQEDEALLRFQDKLTRKYQSIDFKRSEEVGSGNNYYSSLRFGIKMNTMDYLIVDGGTVNWLEALTQNKKRRLLISGFGTELMYKISNLDGNH